MQTLTDVGNLSLGGSAFVELIQDVNWQSTNEFDEYQSASRFRKAAELVKKHATMKVPLRRIKSGQRRVTHLDFTVATLAGLSFKEEMTNLSLKVSNPVNPAPCVGQLFQLYSVDPGGSITADISMEIADSNSVAIQLMLLAESDAVTDSEAVLTFTLNGSPVTLPGWIAGNSHSVAGRQKVSIPFQGNDPGTTYPTAPTGTSSLLERALNAPRTPIPFQFTSKLVGGADRTGYLLISGAEISIEDSKIVAESYDFVVNGAWDSELTEEGS